MSESNDKSLAFESDDSKISNNGSLYLLLYEFERAMRNFILNVAEEDLREHYNDNWEEEFYKKISANLLKDITKNCKREKDIAIYTGMKIDYKKEDFLPFAFIQDAVELWWDTVFSKYFKHLQYFKTDIDKVKNVRNAISHFRITTTETQLETFSICKRLLTIVYGKIPVSNSSSIIGIDSIMDLNSNEESANYCDVKKVYTARSEVHEDIQKLIKKAFKVQAIGISNNEVTIKIGDKDYIDALERGTKFSILFLDPNGKNVSIREKEENVIDNFISNATNTSLYRLERLKQELEFDEQVHLFDQIEIVMYDDIPRCNMIFIDDKFLFVQYYANYVKGENNPTFLVENDGTKGIYSFYRKIFDRTKKRYCKLEADL